MIDIDCVLHFPGEISEEKSDSDQHPLQRVDSHRDVAQSNVKPTGYQGICRILKQRSMSVSMETLTVQVLYDNLLGERQCLDILSATSKSNNNYNNYSSNRNKRSAGQNSFTPSLQIELQQICVQGGLFFDDFTLTFSKPAFQQLLLHYPQDQRTFQAIDTNHFYAQKKPKIEHIDTNNHSTLLESGTERIFEIFTRQESAFVYFDQHVDRMVQNRCKVFTYESVQTGKRHFLVADLHSFCKEYFQQILPHQRHVYEIIRENFPCRLYFDLEFKYFPDADDFPQSPFNNQHVDGKELTQQWIHLVMWKLFEVYGIAVSWEDVIVLDSTTTSKFSKHVTFQLRPAHRKKEYIFPNNIDMNILLKSILYDISLPCVPSTTTADKIVFSIDGKHRTPKKEFEKLWLYSTSSTAPQAGGNSEAELIPSRSFFVDTGVYTRNRAFRIFSSCKFGKKQSFQLLEDDKLMYGAHVFNSTTSTRPSILEKLTDVLLQTLVIPHDLLRTTAPHTPTSTNVALRSPTAAEVQSWRDFDSFANYFQAAKYEVLPPFAEKATLCKVNSNLLVMKGWQWDCAKLQARSHFSLYHSRQQPAGQEGEGNRRLFSSSSVANRIIAQSPYPKTASWFPALDVYINRFASSRGPEPTAAYIYTWVLLLTRDHPQFPVYTIRYTIQNNRYCERIQRVHKSNAIFLEVNLMSGELCQGCWDGDCRGFRSPPLLLPANLLPPPEEVLQLIHDKAHLTN